MGIRPDRCALVALIMLGGCQPSAGGPETNGDRFRGGGCYSGCSAEVSPDGKSLLYASVDERALGDIAVMDLATGGRSLVDGTARYEGQASWSIDGESIFFISERFGAPNVFSVKVATRQVARVTTNAKPEYSPFQISAQQLVFVRRQGATADEAWSDELILKDLGAGGGEEIVPLPRGYKVPAGYSASKGTVYAMVGEPGHRVQSLYACDLTTRKTELLVGDLGWAAAVTPDGSAVYYVNDPDEPQTYELYRRSLAAGDPGVKQITRLGGYIASLSMDRRGTGLAFIWDAKGEPGKGIGQIITLDISSPTADIVRHGTNAAAAGAGPGSTP